MAKQHEFVTEIHNDLDALSKLFEANQFVTSTTRSYDEAKTAKKQAEEYRDSLLSHLDAYTVHRREVVARQEALGQGFKMEPLPPWMSSGQDPDKGHEQGPQPGAA
jgi:hypothetical protein